MLSRIGTALSDENTNARCRVFTYSSWLNLAERWFALLTERCVTRESHHNTRELEAAIRTFLDHNNGDPRPFLWTKTGYQILERVRRFCEHTLADHAPEMLNGTSTQDTRTAVS